MDKRGQQTLQVEVMNIQLAKSPSEETLYQNAVQKRTSSSSEDNGLNLSDESNMLNNLILEARAESGNDSCDKEQRHQPQPSTSNQPRADKSRETPEDIADTMVWLLEKA